MGETAAPVRGSQKPSRGTARKTIGEMVNEKLTPERVGELVDTILDLKGLQWGFCTACKKHVQVEVKDGPKIVSSLKELLEQAEGRAQAEEAGGLTIVVERPAYREAV